MRRRKQIATLELAKHSWQTKILFEQHYKIKHDQTMPLRRTRSLALVRVAREVGHLREDTDPLLVHDCDSRVFFCAKIKEEDFKNKKTKQNPNFTLNNWNKKEGYTKLRFTA